MNKRCWLKHTKNGNKVNLKIGVGSYNMDCQGLRSNDRIDEYTHKDYDFSSADIGTIKNVATIYDCVHRCEQIEGCLGVAYSPSQKICRPKDERLGENPGPKKGIESVEMECCVHSC